MASISRTGKLAIIVYLAIVHLLAFLFVLEQINGGKDRDAVVSGISPDSASTSALPGNDSGLPPARLSAPAQFVADDSDPGRLMIPVAGVKAHDLQDTYTQSRSGGRVHNAIDIMAPEGTPVVAVADGEIAKLFDSKQGGITIYQWGAGRKHVYYYAHLQRRAEGIAEGTTIRRGTVLGFVGNTGNAGPDNFHLHFSVMIPHSPDRHWEGNEINPYPLLKEGIEVPAAR